MTVRRFWLKNAKDELYQLDNTQFFLDVPKGLGFSKKIGLVRLGNEEIITSEQVNLLSVQGDILFINPSNSVKYQYYFDFINFLTKKPIYLYYKTPNNEDPYFSQVSVTQLDKTQVSSEDGILSCPINLKMLSFWQTAKTSEMTVYPNIATGKFYPLVRDTSAGYHYGGSALNNVELINNGTMEIGINIKIIGNCIDPQINFYTDENVQYGVAKLNGTFDYVEIDSVDSTENILLKNNDSVLANPLSYQDLSVGSPNDLYVTFIKLQTGKSKLTFSFSNNFEGRVELSWRETYVSV